MLTLCLLLQSYLYAQEKLNIKLGKITAADFDLGKAVLDTEANPIVIADIGNTFFEGNAGFGFTLVRKRFLRVKILNTNGLEAAAFKISLQLNPSDRDYERIEVRGITYNLENGSPAETALDPVAVIKENYSTFFDL